MARSATTTDVFTAIAEPTRRNLLESLAGRERPVSELVSEFDLDQPSISKHLGVLRTVGLVQVRKDGQRRLYKTNPSGLKTVHDWSKFFERYWKKQLGRIKARAEVAVSSKQKSR